MEAGAGEPVSVAGMVSSAAMTSRAVCAVAGSSAGSSDSAAAGAPPALNRSLSTTLIAANAFWVADVAVGAISPPLPPLKILFSSASAVFVRTWAAELPGAIRFIFSCDHATAPSRSEGMGVGAGVGDDVGDGVGEGVGDAVGEGVGAGVGDGVGEGVGEGVGGAGVGNGVGNGVGYGVGACVWK